jgi:hypothetical protein
VKCLTGDDKRVQTQGTSFVCASKITNIAMAHTFDLMLSKVTDPTHYQGYKIRRNSSIGLRVPSMQCTGYGEVFQLAGRKNKTLFSAFQSAQIIGKRWKLSLCQTLLSGDYDLLPSSGGVP